MELRLPGIRVDGVGPLRFRVILEVGQGHPTIVRDVIIPGLETALLRR